jgi:hypothetical protein
VQANRGCRLEFGSLWNTSIQQRKWLRGKSGGKHQPTCNRIGLKKGKTSALFFYLLIWTHLLLSFLFVCSAEKNRKIRISVSQHFFCEKGSLRSRQSQDKRFTHFLLRNGSLPIFKSILIPTSNRLRQCGLIDKPWSLPLNVQINSILAAAS